MTLGLELYAGIGDILLIDVGEGCARLDAGVFQTLEHVDYVRRMNTTRTGTTGEEIVGILTE